MQVAHLTPKYFIQPTSPEMTFSFTTSAVSIPNQHSNSASLAHILLGKNIQDNTFPGCHILFPETVTPGDSWFFCDPLKDPLLPLSKGKAYLSQPSFNISKTHCPKAGGKKFPGLQKVPVRPKPRYLLKNAEGSNLTSCTGPYVS